MADHTDDSKTLACNTWQIALADELDGQLSTSDEVAFSEHKATCVRCSELFEQARQGREWLGFMNTEPTVPAGLLSRILAQTGPEHPITRPVITSSVITSSVIACPVIASSGIVRPVADGQLASSPSSPVIPLAPPVWQQPEFASHAGASNTRSIRSIRSMGANLSMWVRRRVEPRLMMTAAMAFFSIALTLNLAGIRLDKIQLGEFGQFGQLEWMRPKIMQSYMERRLMAASTPIIRTYDHVRSSYAVESRVRVLRHTSEVLRGTMGQTGQDETQPPRRNPQTHDQPTGREHDGLPAGPAGQSTNQPATHPPSEEIQNSESSDGRTQQPIPQHTSQRTMHRTLQQTAQQTRQQTMQQSGQQTGPSITEREIAWIA